MRKREVDNLPGRKLSRRELETLRWIAGGLSAEEIATKLGLSINTVKQYAHFAIRKLKAKNSAHAVSLAFKKGMLRW